MHDIREPLLQRRYPETLRNSVLCPRWATTTRTVHRVRGQAILIFRLFYADRRIGEAGGRRVCGPANYTRFDLETSIIVSDSMKANRAATNGDGQLAARRSGQHVERRDHRLREAFLLIERISQSDTESELIEMTKTFCRFTGAGGGESISPSPDTAKPTNVPLYDRQPLRLLCPRPSTAHDIINGGRGLLNPSKAPVRRHNRRAFMPLEAISSGQTSAGT